MPVLHLRCVILESKSAVAVRTRFYSKSSQSHGVDARIFISRSDSLQDLNEKSPRFQTPGAKTKTFRHMFFTSPGNSTFRVDLDEFSTALARGFYRTGVKD